MISQKEDDHYHTYPPEDTSCKLLTGVNSLDTNYIPHKKNNIWEYCSGYTVIAPKQGKVVYDDLMGRV